MSRPPPPPRGAEFVEAPKAPKKMYGLNELAPKAPDKFFDRPKVRNKIWPNLLRGRGGVQGRRGGGGGGGAELFERALVPVTCWFLIRMRKGQEHTEHGLR